MNNDKLKDSIYELKDYLTQLSNKSMDIRKETSCLEEGFLSIDEYSDDIQDLRWLLDDIEDTINSIKNL